MFPVFHMQTGNQGSQIVGLDQDSNLVYVYQTLLKEKQDFQDLEHKEIPC